MQNNKPIWFNKDTYQTIKEGKVNSSIEVIDLSEKKPKPKAKIMVATPCHSDVSMHYTRAALKFQLDCVQNNILCSFTLMKSSLVTQGRNLCVAEFLNHEDNYEHMLFIDSDIDFNFSTIMKMLEADKDIIACPYPMKTFDTDKMWKRMNQTDMVKNAESLLKGGYMFPIKIHNKDGQIFVKDGICEVTHAATGCMLIKRKVITDLIKAHPELEIYQPTVINGKEVKKDNFFNLFDTLHDTDSKRYYGEDFGFCQRWRDLGGKVYCYIMDYITHVGEHQYCGRFFDELQHMKRIDDPTKIK